MRRTLVVLLVLAGLVAGPLPSAVAVGNLSRAPGDAAYDVRLRADATGTNWTGRERITFANTSDVPLTEVWLRLWGNAWDGCASPVEVSRFAGGKAATPTVNCTAVKVTLTKPLRPGKKTTVAFDVTMTAPDRAERFGRSGKYRFFGNALPVLAVRDQAGWHLEPDVGIGESYYTLASDFVVRLDHPAGLSVPATGVATRHGSTSTVSVAKQVRDFAWAAGPFQQSTTKTPAGTTVRTWWTDVVKPAAVADARTKGAAALDDFGRRFGKYPYGEVDLVLNDNWESFSGMEYPGFVLLVAPPDEEGPVVHELAHQWWYGIVGNNEYADPWLDESLAVYSSYLHWGDSQEDCWNGPLEHAISNDMGYWKQHGPGWSAYVYSYGACMLADLERVLGSPAMAKMLKDYAKAHWYGVSTPAAFKAAAQAATSKDLTAFWKDHGIS
ncbi:peptidase M1-like protein [Kribbella amoyensis]|uniref:Peptidase M1-like protein n=1 Tax=Kribbella amoyensis TaxID=996641 RepID=A0A561BSP3_9ACTN|nr:M1 family metallopeptidase [Kribbella amoyensis]TWD81876.1 peptidase M1-like protein [Kribbella amoyensis]